ncbi:MAG: heavy-metal-associated domain-containing protein, partial [Bacteroidota bacterium]
LIRVDGLSCPFCALGLEKNLKKIEGVTSVTIKLKEGITTLEVKDGGDLSDEEIKQRVKDAGFTPREIKRESRRASSENLDSITLKIEGMVCQYCEKNVQNSLADVNGVSHVHVDREKGEAMVTYDKSLTAIEELIKAVEDAGSFKAQAKK